MTADELLTRLRGMIERSDAGLGTASVAEVREVEARLGFSLPPLYVRLVTEVSNGGLGIGLAGLPPSGFTDDDLGGSLVEEYTERQATGPGDQSTKQLLLILHTGAILTYLDCSTPDGAIVTEYLFIADDSVRELVEHSGSLAQWLSQWVNGANPVAELEVVVGHRDGTNPFTGRPHRYEKKKLRGVPRRLEHARRDGW